MTALNETPMKKLASGLTIFWLVVAVSSASMSAQAVSGSASNDDARPAATAKAASGRPHKKDKTHEQPSKRNRSQSSSRSEASAKPSDSDIAAAKSAGKVWVNLDSGIYHKSGRWYGKTKNGKFMTEAEAKAASYKASQRN